MKTPFTREQWLIAATDELRLVFTGKGYTVPANVRMTCGFPSTMALSQRKQRIGECWSAKCSEGKVFEIFISPLLADPVKVLAVLVHELVHATVGLEEGHNAVFKRCATAVGLEGKMTATTAGAELTLVLRNIAKRIGEYPHKRLIASADTAKKQTTRLIKVQCESCEYTARVTGKWIDAAGAPICPCCETQMEVQA